MGASVCNTGGDLQLIPCAAVVYSALIWSAECVSPQQQMWIGVQDAGVRDRNAWLVMSYPVYFQHTRVTLGNPGYYHEDGFQSLTAHSHPTAA